MDTQSTAAEGRFELEEKYRRWKETHLSTGDVCSAFVLLEQLEALDDKRLIAAHKDAMAGLLAEKLLATTSSRADFHFAVGLIAGLLFKRGLHHKRSWCE